VHRFQDINTYLPNIKTSRDLDHPIWGKFVITRETLFGPTRAQNLIILSPAIPVKSDRCKILKRITWPGPRPFRDGRHPKANTLYSLQAHKIWRR